MLTVAFDVGGTFTDVIVLSADGTLRTSKLPSLMETIGTDMAAEVARGDEVGRYVHGTTVATNALLEGKLARLGLITTRGFRDILEMRSQRRPNIYDVNWQRSRQLVPRELRLELDERMLADGTVDRELDDDQVRAVAAQLVAAGVEAIAVSLINAYANPAHERRVAAIIRKEHRELALSVSTEWFSEVREYERTSTTAVNAALMPVVSRYLRKLQSQLGAQDSALLVMQSNGGLMDAGQACTRPVQIIESGPAAGVLAAARLARLLGSDRVLAFDMGGTTAKASLIRGGIPLERPGGEVGGTANVASRFFGGDGHAIRIPAFDISEVGAGGGSIGWIDSGGALKVGPTSAGANPGPACYGRGGLEPTVTDANVVLGYINPEGIAGTTFQIDRQAAHAAIESRIAGPLGMSVIEAAYGIVQVADATMIRALRAATSDRGEDPRTVELIAFGGSGPIHAARLAGVLGVRKVMVPPLSGIFSAMGLLTADWRHDAIKSHVAPLESVSQQDMGREYEAMELALGDTMIAEGVAPDRIRFLREVDVKYRSQDTAVTLPMPEFGDDFAQRLHATFVAGYSEAYGHTRATGVDLTSLRVRATASSGMDALPELLARVQRRDAGAAGNRQAYFGAAANWRDVPVIGREALASARAGPLIVEEWDTSILVPPGWTACLQGAYGVVILERIGDAS